MTEDQPIVVGLAGTSNRNLLSVQRVQAFYLSALSEAFEVVHLSEHSKELPALDAVINFRGKRFWSLQPRPPVPVLQCLLGGAVLNTDALRERVSRCWTSDVLIGNCTSDGAIVEQLGDVGFCQLPLPIAEGIEHIPDARRRQGIADDELVLGFVGRLMPQKNPHQVLRLAARLQKRVPHWRVRVIMLGHYCLDYPILPYATADYERYLSGLGAHLGVPTTIGFTRDHHELAEMYSAFDVLVHPTHVLDENFGYVPVEAMACGTAVVGCAYGGLKDTIIHGQTGFLIPTWATPGGLRMDMRPAVEAIASLCENEEQKVRIRNAAIRHVRTAYNRDRCASILQEAVRWAVAQHRREGARPATPRPRTSPEIGDLLPAISRPWSSFSEAVTAYVSTTPPHPAPSDPIAPYGPLYDDMLHDPTWPVSYELTPLDRRIFSLGETTPIRAANALGVDLDTILARVSALVARGVLVSSPISMEEPWPLGQASVG